MISIEVRKDGELITIIHIDRYEWDSHYKAISLTRHYRALGCEVTITETEK